MIRRAAGLTLAVVTTLPAALGAQAVERTDTPKGGELRLTFDPRIFTWSEVYTSAGLVPLGAPLTGDSVGGAGIPLLASMQQDVRTASGLPGFVANLGQGLFTAYEERRITPLAAEIGITNRLSLTLDWPIVRLGTRTAFALNPTGANVGANPLAAIPGAAGQYSTFFNEFNAALVQLGDSLSAGGHYGCPSSPQCAQAQQLLASGETEYASLERITYGAGTPGAPAAPFMPLASSAAGLGIDTTIAQMQRTLAATFNVAGFTSPFLLSSDTLADSAGVGAFAQLLSDSANGFGYAPLGDTYRFGLGNISLEAKYRFVDTKAYRAAAAFVARLPTEAQDSAFQVVDAPLTAVGAGFEGRLLQEFSVGRFWINLAMSAGTQSLATQSRRVAPVSAFLVPAQATTTLNWAPGDYASLDLTPLYHLTPQLSAGFTASYWTKRSDRYTYASAQDSLALASAFGAPIPASVLDLGTSVRLTRVGIALTYVAAGIEGGFTVEKTVSGAGGMVAAVTEYELRLRLTRKLF